MIARDVMDLNGRVLLTAGVKTTPKHLKIFKIWGIAEISIEGQPGAQGRSAEVKETGSKRLDEIKDQLKTAFLYNDLDHPFIKELFGICIERQLNNPLEK